MAILAIRDHYSGILGKELNRLNTYANKWGESMLATPKLFLYEQSLTRTQQGFEAIFKREMTVCTRILTASVT